MSSFEESGNEVLFVGTEQGIEARVLPKEGLPLRFITVGKLKGMKFISINKNDVDCCRGACISPFACYRITGPMW